MSVLEINYISLCGLQILFEQMWREVKGSAVKGGKSGRTVKGIYGWWSEVKW
jgi:uncharacterized protein YuzB (UPF0349 family)